MTDWAWRELGDSCEVTDGAQAFLVCDQTSAQSLCKLLSTLSAAAMPSVYNALRLYTDEIRALRCLRDAAILWRDGYEAARPYDRECVNDMDMVDAVETFEKAAAKL